MAPQALTTVYATQADVEQVLSVAGVLSRLDDDGDQAVNDTEQLRMTDAIARATETCNYYLYWRYDPTNLATYSNLVNQWCSDLAAYVLCRARGNPVPESLIEAAQEAEAKMTDIQRGRTTLPNVPMRRNQGPTWDNIRVDVRYRFKCIRVEQNTSSQQPTSRPSSPDWAEAFTYEI